MLNKLNLNNKKYVIFDMDGTLVDSLEMWNEVDYQLIKMFSGKTIDLSVIGEEKDKFLKENNTGNIYLEYGGYLIEKYNLNITKEELLKLRWLISNDFIINKVDYKEGVVEVIKYLKELNYTLILATAGSKEHIDIYSYQNKKTSYRLNIYEYFDLILTKEDVEKKKPNPEIHKKILKILNATPNECLVIEDSLAGIQAAISADIETICIYDKHSDKERNNIKQLTDYHINNFSDLFNYLLNYYQTPNSIKIKKHTLQ